GEGVHREAGPVGCGADGGTRMRARVAVVGWSVGVPLGLAAEWVRYGWLDPTHWIPDLAAGWALMTCGWVVTYRCAYRLSGGLLIGSGAAWFVPNFAGVGGAVLSNAAVAATYQHRGFLLHLLVAFPSGRGASRWVRAVVVVSYAAALSPPLWDRTAGVVGVSAAMVAISARRYVSRVGSHRRARLFALLAASVFASVLVGGALVGDALLPHAPYTASSLLGLQTTTYAMSLCVVGGLLAAGLLSSTFDPAAVTDLVVELGGVRSVGLRDQLARALGDPTIDVAYWNANTACYLDGYGRRVAEAQTGRATTHVERDGQPVAVLVHDPAVLADPTLVEAVSSAARLAAVNHRLQEEVKNRLAEATASRARIVEAADQEREVLERRLSDGALTRLRGLVPLLQQARLSARAEASRARISRAEEQLESVEQDLRRFARGMLSRELSELGLTAALTSLVEDFPLPVDLAIGECGASPAAEACVWFCCAEALANVAKHSSATAVRVTVAAQEGAVILEVADNGVGGASALHGSGLRGLSDRVERGGGALHLDSRVGHGTILRVTVPAALRSSSSG
ncbi:MAG: hypothetical protein ABIM89_00785, partial [Mycobacteriales bacterium]